MSSQRRRVTVIGAGYVGTVTAVGLAGLGHRVELVETDPDRLAALRDGRLAIYEPGLLEGLAAAIDRGLVRVAAAPAPDAEAYLVCVAAPLDGAGESDLRQLEAALRSIEPAVHAGRPAVIRSTVPPGGTERLVAALGLPREHVLTNPEFLREGAALEDFAHPIRIVIGAFDDVEPAHVRLLTELYDEIEAPVLVVDVASAELIKNGAGAFLASRLSLANEIAALAEAYGADAGPILEAIGQDPRIGGQFLSPALGFGGSCLPKELRVLEAAAAARDIDVPTVRAASRSNRAQADRFARRVLGLLDIGADGGGARVAMLGLAFKAGTDDVRGSPALDLARRLLAAGVEVAGYDPRAGANARQALPGIFVVDGALDALEGADAAVIGTEWPELRDIDWAMALGRMRGPVIVDGRRLLDAAAMRSLGFRYEAVGLPALPAEEGSASPGARPAVVATPN
jgi:UDPglucose 6-dehydrogenase